MSETRSDGLDKTKMSRRAAARLKNPNLMSMDSTLPDPPPYTTETGIEIAERNLREAFEAFGIDPEDLVQKILEDPIALPLASDPRPIVRALCNAVEADMKHKSEAVSRDALVSLEHLKDYVDQHLDQILTDAREMRECIRDDRDVSALRTYCIEGYKEGHDKFFNSVWNSMNEVAQQNQRALPSYLSSWLGAYGFEDMKNEVLHYYTNTAHASTKAHASVLAATTWDELLVACINGPDDFISGPQMRVSLDEGRKLGGDFLREYLCRRCKEEIEDVSLDGRRSRFSNYCLTTYPLVVEEQLFTLPGRRDKETLSRVAFKEVVDRWRALSTVERNEFAN